MFGSQLSHYQVARFLDSCYLDLMPTSKNQTHKAALVDLPVEDHKKLKIRAIQEGRTMQDLVTEIVEEWLDQHGGQ